MKKINFYIQLKYRFIGLFSIQRLIVVYFPFKKNELCNKSKTRKFILIIVSFSLLFYSITLVSSGFDEKYGKACVIKENWSGVFEVLNFVDTIQTMVIPFIIISMSNVLIGYRLMRESKQLKYHGSFRVVLYRLIPFNSAKNNVQSRNKSRENLKNSNDSNNKKLRRRITLKEVKKHNSKSNKETTKILLIIASTFLILNFPLAASKTYYFFAANEKKTQTSFFTTISYSFFNDSVQIINNTISLTGNNDKLEDNKTTKEIIEKIAQFIYYINYSINFYLYTFKTKQFREHFFNSIKKKY